MMRETRIIGQDVWWDHDKRAFRKKRLDLEKIPLRFRCPLCGTSVVPTHERKKTRRETTDHWKTERHNRKVLAVYWKRDRPSKDEFLEWHDRICAEHKDEFKEHVYIEYFEDPAILRLNRAFYGRYVCNKCVKNHPNQYIGKQNLEDSVKNTQPPKKKTGIWINGYFKRVDEVIEIVLKDEGKTE